MVDLIVGGLKFTEPTGHALVLGFNSGEIRVFDYPEQIDDAVNAIFSNKVELNFFFIGETPDYLRILPEFSGDRWIGYATHADGEQQDLYAVDVFEAIQSVPDDAQEVLMHRTKDF